MLRMVEFGADVSPVLRGRHESELAARRLVTHETRTRVDDEHAAEQLSHYVAHIMRRSATGDLFDPLTRWHDNGPPEVIFSFTVYDDTGATLLHQ